MSLLQAIIDGILIGGVYAVISIGLTLVYGVMGIVNFAQAEFLTIGMFVAWFAWAVLGLDPVVAAPLSFAVAFAIGWVVQDQLIARVLNAPSVAQIFLTVGILIVIENGSLLLFGSQFRSVTTSYQTSSLSLGPLFVSVPYLIAFGMLASRGCFASLPYSIPRMSREALASYRKIASYTQCRAIHVRAIGA